MPIIRPSNSSLPIVLCIAGFDPSGGSGLLADARACNAQSALSVCVQTALVPQNTCGVRSIEVVAPEVVQSQIETLLEDIEIDAVKIGLIPNRPVLEALLPYLKTCVEKNIPIVVDPVFAPSTGPEFSNHSTIKAIEEFLLPLATIVTPNTIEAQILSGMEVTDVASMEAAAQIILAETNAKNVLVKGGHVATNTTSVTDVFFDGIQLTHLTAPFEAGVEVRGTGCQLASALAAHLAWGREPLEALRLAKSWLAKEIRQAQAMGGGRRVTRGLIDDFSE